MHGPLPIEIAGLGWSLPACRVTSGELERELDLPSGWIEDRTGVRERRYVDGETTVGMAADAARMAMGQAGCSVDDLDAIVGASCAPQQLIPCTAALLQHELGAPDGRSACWDINATCLSFVVALDTAALLIASGRYRRMLIFSSEIAARSLNPAEPESAVLIGDGAAAAVVTAAGSGSASAFWGARFATHSSGAGLARLEGFGALHHPNDPATTPEMNLFHMDGPAVFRRAVKLLPGFLEDFFATLGWQPSEVSCVVPHQASRHGIDFAASRLGFRRDQFFINLADRGNCIAASIPLAFAEAVHGGRIRRGDRVLLLGTGAGLTLGAAALTF